MPTRYNREANDFFIYQKSCKRRPFLDLEKKRGREEENAKPYFISGEPLAMLV